MARGDRTGPNGQGPKTGRGLGFCAGNDRPGFMESGIGFRGGGRFRSFNRNTDFGRGMGRGRGFAFCAANIQAQMPQEQAEKGMTEEQEKEMLKQELEALKQEQKEIEKRIKELR